VQQALTALKLSTGSGVAEAAEAVAAGRFPGVKQLVLKDGATGAAGLADLIALLGPRLQQLSCMGGGVISSLPLLVLQGQLRQLELELPQPSLPSSQRVLLSCLPYSLSQLTSLSRLVLTGPDNPPGVEPVPLGPLSCLAQLRELSLGGAVQPASLPPALTAITLSSTAGLLLPVISSCLQLARVELKAALLPDEFVHDDARGFWAALTPLTGLTALEGCVAGLEGEEMLIGDGNDDSWSVVSRLRRLCLGHAENAVDGIGVFGSHRISGIISGLTALEALWVEHDTEIFPSNLRELRITSTNGDAPRLGAYSNITSLTLELHEDDEVCFSDLPPLLKELTLVQQGWDPDSSMSLGKLHPLPHLRRLNVHGFELSSVAMCCIVAMHPCLEEVHFYRPLLKWFVTPKFVWESDAEGVLKQAQRALELLARKPVVMVSEVAASLEGNGGWISPVVLKTLKA
jgi:hypothetical protein